MADESAGQCGPCVFGLRAIGDATTRVARGAAGAGDLDDIERWTSQIAGRGACHHPDGAVQLMVSALDVFGDEFAHHARTGRCSDHGIAGRCRLGWTSRLRVDWIKCDGYGLCGDLLPGPDRPRRVALPDPPPGAGRPARASTTPSGPSTAAR